MSSTDNESVYKQLISKELFTKDEIFNDMILLLFTGFDTTSHGIASILYNIHKNPRVLNKLLSGLKLNGITDISTDDESSLKETYEQWDYLNYVVKEGIRIDPPVMNSLVYNVKENIEIWGVPLDKGSKVLIQTLLPHLNHEEWREPDKFIPERFDPESEYYFKPNSTSQLRDPKSYIPFSFGIRNCPCQSLAKLELKIILSRILTILDLEVSLEQLNNNFWKFNLMSQMHLHCKIIKKKI